MSKFGIPTYTSSVPTEETVPLTDEQKNLAVYFQDSMTFDYSGHTVLRDISISLPAGSRCLLVGGNGAGKSTLLRLLGGRHMTNAQVFLHGKLAFQDTSLNIERTLMDTTWGMRASSFGGSTSTYGCDIPVREMMQALQNEFPERREKLVRLLRIDLDWRMHLLSDGQRRRVQLFLGLLRPFKILLLDEVTAVLDVVCRLDLMEFIKEETEQRGASVVYTTHILDGLDDWTTHLLYLTCEGRVGVFGRLQEVAEYQALRQRALPSPLLYMVAGWIRAERDGREREEKKGATPDPRDHAGGFTPGRLNAYIFEDERQAAREEAAAARKKKEEEEAAAAAQQQ